VSTQFWITNPKGVESCHEPKETRCLWVNPVAQKSQKKSDEQWATNSWQYCFTTFQTFGLIFFGSKQPRFLQSLEKFSSIYQVVVFWRSKYITEQQKSNKLVKSKRGFNIIGIYLILR
jgi:hypothetical protein